MSRDIASRLLAWHEQHGRKDLPWQHDRTPYRVWLSEIMLQQTQVATVRPYFERFTARYPDVSDLAAAELDEVLHLWTGLGYYARARNLHKAAGEIVARHSGALPNDQEALEALPGIGRSTAAAIRAIAYGAHAAILDANVKRVLARHDAIAGDPGKAGTQATLWALAETYTPARRTGVYTQAIMDLGATVCTARRPACAVCPLADTCLAHARGEESLYPEKKAKQTKPVRSTSMWLLTSPQGACLLERQPEPGLWGGLWSPLMRAQDIAAEAVCAELALEPAGPPRALEPFRHTFTHFHLDITPFQQPVTDKQKHAQDGDLRLWYEPGDNRPIGLSVPAVKLLARLSDMAGR
jgi:A/G-specific adenine glycosylase